MNMPARQKYKVVLGIATIIIVIAVFGLILTLAEKNANAKSEADMEKAQAYTKEPTMELYDEENVISYVSYHNIESFLIIGTDASGNEQASGEDYYGNLSDFLLLVVIDNTDKTYGFIQIDRDTMTDVPLLQKDGNDDASAVQQICLAHYYGEDSKASGANTVNSVSSLLFDMPVDGYYAINMDAIPAVNALLGGVTVTINEDMSQVDPAFINGATITLTDEQAFKFTRGRQGIGDEKNTSRMGRQLVYMQGVMEKAKQRFAEDNKFANEFYAAFEDIAVTDMSEGKLTNMASKTFDYTSYGVLRMEGEHKLGVSLTDGIEHEQFYPEKSSIVQILQKLCSIEVMPDEELDEEYEEIEEDSEEYSE